MATLTKTFKWTHPGLHLEVLELELAPKLLDDSLLLESKKKPDVRKAVDAKASERNLNTNSKHYCYVSWFKNEKTFRNITGKFY